MKELLNCILAGWQPGIGDPTWQGWATTLLYVVVSAVAFWTVGHGGFPAVTRRRERRFWLLLGVVLAFLAVNKQLDLQSALTQAGRCSAHAQGWYDQRRLVQVGFLLVLGTGALLFLAAVLSMMRGTLAWTALPAIGLAFVLGFVLMRAVGFHYIDWALGHPVLGLKVNMILEWTGPLLILLGAVANLRRNR